MNLKVEITQPFSVQLFNVISLKMRIQVVAGLLLHQRFAALLVYTSTYSPVLQVVPLAAICLCIGT